MSNDTLSFITQSSELSSMQGIAADIGRRKIVFVIQADTYVEAQRKPNLCFKSTIFWEPSEPR
jgi:hypothetical protein